MPLHDENGKVISFYGADRDVTWQVKMEEALKAKNKELENYLYIASHDLRSPLVNIQGFSSRVQKNIESLKELLLDQQTRTDDTNKLEQILEDEIPKAFHFIFSNVVKMDALIKGLLRVSRTGRYALQCSQVNMEELMQRVLANFAFQVEQIQAQITVAALPSCWGDPDLLNQLFSNLIDNAIKYRDTSKPLHLSIKGKQENLWCTYTITDNGPGLNKDNMEKIWKIFHRVNPGADQPGEGIGLNIAQKIVEKHHGEIWAESQEGLGTTFFVRLSTEDISHPQFKTD